MLGMVGDIAVVISEGFSEVDLFLRDGHRNICDLIARGGRGLNDRGGRNICGAGTPDTRSLGTLGTLDIAEPRDHADLHLLPSKSRAAVLL